MEWRHGCLMDGGESEDQEPVGGNDLESVYSSQSRRSICEQDPNENEVINDHPDEVSDINTESPSNKTNPQTQAVNYSHANAMPNTETQIRTDKQGVKTRAGRVVKKVSHLIESMA